MPTVLGSVAVARDVIDRVEREKEAEIAARKAGPGAWARRLNAVSCAGPAARLDRWS
jgi:hypothetical protein